MKTSLNAATPASIQNISSQTGDAYAQINALIPARFAMTAGKPWVLDDSGNSITNGVSIGTLQSHGDSAWATATGFSTLTATQVWASATRTLSSGANIVLEKGTGLVGLNDIAAGAQMDIVNTPNTFAIAAIQSGLSTLTAAGVWMYATRVLTAGTNIILTKGVGVTGFNDVAPGTQMDLVSNALSSIATSVSGITVETGISLLQTQRVTLAMLAGLVSGGGTTTITFKDPNGVNTRIAMTVDQSGNRTAVVITA
jgi:hypothetical protein